MKLRLLTLCALVACALPRRRIRGSPAWFGAGGLATRALAPASVRRSWICAVSLRGLGSGNGSGAMVSAGASARSRERLSLTATARPRSPVHPIAARPASASA